MRGGRAFLTERIPGNNLCDTSAQRMRKSCIYTVGQRKKITAVIFSPAHPQPDQRGTNMGQMRKVPVDEIAWFLVYRMDETISQLGANNGIPVAWFGRYGSLNFRGEEGEGNCASHDPRGRRLLAARKKVTVVVKKVRAVNYILASLHHDRMRRGNVVLPRSYILYLKTKSEIIWTTHW